MHAEIIECNMFLTKEDLYSKIREGDLRQIVGQTDGVIEHALCFAVGKVRSYLGRYDTDQIFSARGDSREGMIVSLCVDIAIYELVAIAQPNIDLTDRRARATAALDYLTEVRDNNLPTGWPVPDREIENQDAKPVLFGGNRARGNYF